MTELGGETGEIAVRENGTVTAVDAPTLDGTIAVNLDRDVGPEVGVPPETAVSYHDDGADDDSEVATDGGVVESVTVSQHGVGLDREKATYAVVTAAGSFMASGALFATQQPLGGAAALAAGGVLAGILSKQRDGVVA